MATLIKEERYIVYIDTEENVLSVQELLSGLEPWPERFRAQIPPSVGRKATTVYGSTGREVVERATDYLSRFSGARTWLSDAATRLM